MEHELLQSKNLSTDKYEIEKSLLMKKHSEELKDLDIRIILKLDEKVHIYIILLFRFINY